MVTNTQQSFTDSEMVRRIWPCLVAAALGLVPFTIFSNFLVDLADTAGTDVAFLGTLRGLGGVAALIVGVALAPLIDRTSRRVVAGASLVVLALACLIGVVGSTGAWIVFCLFVGAGTATLNPALSAMASDTFSDNATAGRAATLVSATMTLTAMLAAPLLALPALFWGWRGDLVAIAAMCVIAAVFLLSPRFHTASNTTTASSSSGYFASFKVAARLPAALPLLGVSALRTAAFMGQLAFIAALYDELFGLGPGIFSLVWSLSGLSFFLGNWFGGKALKTIHGPRKILWVVSIAAVVATASVSGLFLAPALPVALAMTSLTAIAHAVVAAGVTTLLVRVAGSHRGTVLSLNGAGQSLGTFGGAGLAGLGLAITGAWWGVGLVLAVATALGAGLAAFAAMTLRGVVSR